MSSAPPKPPPQYFATASAFRDWLAEHASRQSELIVGFYKVGSGRPSLTWPESVDEALCFGWIDGVRTRIDEHAYKIRFTPRKADSIWSAVNIAKYQTLSAQGRMTKAGVAAYAHRTEKKSMVYAYEQDGIATLSDQEEVQFRQAGTAWAFFQSTPAGYRKVVLHWVTQAKKAQTRAGRLFKLIEACSAGRRLR